MLVLEEHRIWPFFHSPGPLSPTRGLARVLASASPKKVISTHDRVKKASAEVLKDP